MSACARLLAVGVPPRPVLDPVPTLPVDGLHEEAQSASVGRRETGQAEQHGTNNGGMCIYKHEGHSVT